MYKKIKMLILHNGNLKKLIAFLCGALLLSISLIVPVYADDDSYIKIPESKSVVTRLVSLGKDMTMIIDLPRNARDILIGNPEIAEVVARSARKSYIIAKKIGSTNIIYFDARNRRIANIIINIEADVTALSTLFKSKMPNSRIDVEMVNGNVVLSGRVRSSSQVGRAVEIAGKYINEGETQNGKNVINLLTYNAREQVMLKVTIVEMQRTSIKKLGINLSAFGNATATSIVNFNTDNPFTLGTTDGGLSGSFLTPTSESAIKALELIGVVKTLAEPVLTAISGETASFLAGGEFPIPSAYDPLTKEISLVYKPFGVGLTFTPVVLDGGRISLKVNTEVSELSPEGAFSIGGGISVPSIKVRRATTTVELPSGGSLVLAGLIEQTTKKTIAGVPFFKDIPILGALFRSIDYQNNETELVIIATPYLVDPVAEHDIARPDAGLEFADDAKSYFLGQMNVIYGHGDSSGAAGSNNLAGNFGLVDGD